MQKYSKVIKKSGKPFPNGQKIDIVVNINCNNPKRSDLRMGEWVHTESGAYMLPHHLSEVVDGN